MSNISVQLLTKDKIGLISEAFARINWDKSNFLFEQYLKEQNNGARFIWLAFCDDIFAGYITLKLQSQYQPFKTDNIPEIMDLNVLPEFRQQGIASILMQKAEDEAARISNIVGIGVGLYRGDDGGYGPAQRLYIKRGYMPDGCGLTYNYEPVVWGQKYLIDDELILWLRKEL